MANAGNIAGVVLAHLVAVAGCYNPEVKDCTVRCSGETECTSGQTCSDGWCVKGDRDCPKGGDGDNDLTPDAAAVTNDADRNLLCMQGCPNGTCNNGVCVIDCSSPFACRDSDVLCPPNIPCRVMCGYEACDKKIICGLATSCEVQCTGDSSCNDEIQCNSNRCSVTCSGAGACAKRTRCANACACDVACTGTGSCPEVSECPEDNCRLGNGCNSQLAGCDSC